MECKIKKALGKTLKEWLVQLEKYDFIENIIKNHIPNITQTPSKMENAGGFYGKTREMLLSSGIGQINDFKVEKVPIQDIKSGQYVLSLNESSGEIEPAKVNALLDMGEKPIYELVTESGRAVNTTGAHPYLVKDKKDIRDYSLRNLNNLPVEIMSTSDCVLNAFSSDQMPQLNANANAKYWMSFLCGDNFSACSANLLKSSNGTVLICSLISEKSSESSSLFNLLLFNISSKCFPNSKNINSGEINSIFFESEFKESTLNTLPLESRQEYNLLVSTITNIFYLPKDCMNLCDKAISDLSDNSFISCSVNLDLETIRFNLANLSNPGLIMLVITNENLNLDNALISSSNSLGIDIVTSVIEEDNYSDYLNVLNSQWIKVTELNIGDEIAAPNYETGEVKFDKIVSIEAHKPQHVYDLAIEGTHNFENKNLIIPSQGAFILNNSQGVKIF